MPDAAYVLTREGGLTLPLASSHFQVPNPYYLQVTSKGWWRTQGVAGNCSPFFESASVHALVSSRLGWFWLASGIGDLGFNDVKPSITRQSRSGRKFLFHQGRPDRGCEQLFKIWECILPVWQKTLTSVTCLGKKLIDKYQFNWSTMDRVQLWIDDCDLDDNKNFIAWKNIRM